MDNGLVLAAIGAPLVTALGAIVGIRYQNAHTEKVGKVDVTVRMAEANLDASESLLDRYEARIGALEQRLEQVEERLSTITEERNALRETVRRQNSRIKSYEEQVARLQRENGRLREPWTPDQPDRRRHPEDEDPDSGATLPGEPREEEIG